MEYREAASLVVAGTVLPVATIAAVVSVTATGDLHWAVPFFLLLVSPLFAAGGLYLTGARTGALRTPSWIPTRERRTFADQIPDRYHEAFGAETLDQRATDEVDLPSRPLALALVYLVSVPVYTVVLWVLFG